MKKNFSFLILFFVLIFSYSQKAYAQANPDWKLLFLDIAGHTTIKGVEVYSQVNTCKDEDVVFLKFINHNSYPVTVKWLDAVHTTDQKWIKKDQEADNKSLTLDANAEIKGDCSTTSYSECNVKLKNFIDKITNYNEYAIYHFEVLPVKK